jgi:hypothetical protein
LGDKGYIGCDNIVTPYKQKKHQLTLTNNEREYNLNLAHRIKVENYFCHLKKWKVLSHVYRGSVSVHKIIVLCYIVLINVEK